MKILETSIFGNIYFEYFTKLIPFSRYKIDTIFKIYNKCYLKHTKGMMFSRYKIKTILNIQY